jgi:PAS domain S-box-containing protein
MGKEIIKLLYIENDEVDRKAFERFIVKEKLPYDYVSAGSLSEGKRALKRVTFDVVVADYLLGDGTALDLLEAIQADVPLIVLTGKGDEQIAVQAMKAGVSDYLIKDLQGDYLKTLHLTVTNAIRCKREQEEHRTIIKASLDGFCLSDEEGHFLEVNDSYCRITGYSREELLTMSIPDIEVEETAEATSQRLKKVREKRHTRFETRLRNKNGKIIDVEISLNYLTGGESRFFMLIREISERKRAAEALAWESKVNQALADLANMLISHAYSIEDIADLVLTKIRYLTGSRYGFVSSVDPLTDDKLCHTLSRIMKDYPVAVEENRITFPKGEDGLYSGLWVQALNKIELFYTNSPEKHGSFTCTPEDHIILKGFLFAPAIIDGELIGQVALANPFQPYTDRDLDAVKRLTALYALALQRNLAQEELLRHQQQLELLVEKRTSELRRSETRFRALSQATFEGIGFVEKGILIDANQQFADIFGYALNDLPGLKVEELVAPGDRELVKDRILSSGDKHFEHLAIRKDGTTIHIEVRPRRMSSDGRPVGVMAIRDITERKRTEKALAERMKLLALGSDVGRALTRENELNTMLQGCAEAVVEHLGASLARIWTYNRQENILELHASAGVYTHINGAHSSISAVESGIWKIAAEKKPVLTNIVKGDAYITDQEWVKRENMAAFAGYPLIVGEELVGVLAIFSRKPLSKAFIEAIDSVSDEIALGIDRKTAWEALLKEHELLTRVIETSPAAILVFDGRGEITFTNNRSAKMFGVSIDQRDQVIYDIPEWEITDYDGNPIPQEDWPFQKVIRTRAPQYDLPLAVKVPGKQRVLLSFNAAPLLDESGEVEGVVLTMDDVTEKVIVEEMLRQSESRYRGIFDSTDNGVAVLKAVNHGKDFMVLDLNSGGETIDKIKRDKVIGTSFLDMFQGAKESGLFDVLRRVWKSGQPEHLPISRYRKNKISRWLETQVYKLPTGEIVVVYSDETERKRAEEDLRRSEEQYKRLVEGSPGILYSYSTRRGGFYYSDRVESILGYSASALCESPFLWHESIHPDDREKVNQAREGLVEGRDFSIEYRIKDASGNWHWLNDRSIGSLDVEDEVIIEGLAMDITEEKKEIREKELLKNRLQQAQKMEAIGTLAGGIAHDFNNILAAIGGYSEVVSLKVSWTESEMRHLFAQIQKATMRAKELVTQILAFSRRGEQKRKAIRLNPLFKEAIRFLRASIPTTIDIATEICEEPVIINADPTQIHQVLMNLCTNSSYAMSEKGGLLKILLTVESLSSSDVSMYPDIKPGRYAKITVSDSGCGIDQDTTKRIFDPFFTTKPEGVGTGLGLAVVHGIIKSHGGVINVTSEIEKGSIFEILLPAIKEIGKEDTAADVSPLIHGKGERILIVDDEEMILESQSKVLQLLGYDVTAKTNGQEAFEVFLSQPTAFDLIITDQTMPQMTGLELAEKILKLRPEIPIVLCTGFSARISSEEQIKAKGIKEFLSKPVDVKSLVQVLGRLFGK